MAFDSLSKKVIIVKMSFLTQNADLQYKVEVIAREWRQNFMLALGNLIITPQINDVLCDERSVAFLN